MVTAALTGAAPTTSEWSTILLPTKVHLTLDVWRYHLYVATYLIKISESLFVTLFSFDTKNQHSENMTCFTWTKTPGVVGVEITIQLLYLDFTVHITPIKTAIDALIPN